MRLLKPVTLFAGSSNKAQTGAKGKSEVGCLRLTLVITFSVSTMTRKMCVHMLSHTCVRYCTHEFLRLQQGEWFTPGTREHIRRRRWPALARFEFFLVIRMNNL